MRRVVDVVTQEKEPTREADADADPGADADPEPGGGEPRPALRPHRRLLTGLGELAPPVVWAVTGLYLCVLLAYSVLLPTYRAPDEPHHTDLAHHMSENWDYPAWDEADLDPGVQRSLNLVRYHIPRNSAHLLPEEALPRDERPSIEDLDAPGIPTSINQISQHPPLYYVIAGNADRAVELVVGRDLSYDTEVWLYRVVSLLLVAGAPLIIWRIGRILGLPTPVGVAATLFPLAVPQFTHIGSAVNNDSLLLLAFWLSTPVVLRLARGDLSRRTALLAGALTGVGALTKLMALVLPAWVAVALLIAWRRGGRSAFPTVLRAGAWYGLAAMVVGGWWWVRNIVLYQELAPSRFSQILKPHEEFDVDAGRFLQTWAYSTTRRFWGDFGLFDTHLPSIAFGTATVVALVGIGFALLRRDRVAGTAIGDRLLLAGPLLLLVGGQFVTAFRAYQTSGHLPGLQGRYWFGALAAISVVVALGLANLARPLVRYLPLLFLAGAGAMQAVGALTVLRHFWAPDGTPLLTRLDTAVTWSPIPGPIVAAGAAAATLVALTTLALNVAVARHPTPPTPT